MLFQKLFDLARNFLQKDYARFMIVGAGAFLIDFGIYTASFRLLHFNDRLAYAAGVLIATTYAFILNKLWTFQNKGENWAAQTTLFFIGRGVAIGIVYLIYEFLKKGLGGLNVPYHYEASKILSAMSSFVFNYFFAKLVVFRKPKATPGQTSESSR
ncbi:MAG: GtrA family protein [Spirochaetia bacterium]|nr:GtrA family protein [Spirochaetia bacterium]